MTIDIIGIVGTGNMGRGIAEVAAVAAIPVVLVKATAGDLAAVRRAVSGALDKAVARGKLDRVARDAALARIEITADRTRLAGCSLVIESVVEDLEEKRRTLADIESQVSNACVICSNTSSLPLSALAESLENATRFLGLHFFSPVPAMKLVEIATAAQTYPNAVEAARDLVERLGKTPVMVGESSGYIVNRLLVPYLLDGIRALAEGVASAQAIDTAMKLGCGHPLGPLALADAIGLDIVLAMAKTLHKELGDHRFSPPPLLRALVTRGFLGKKSKRGVYDYRCEPPVENAELQPASLCA